MVKVLAHDFNKRAEKSQQKARTPGHRTIFDIEILRTHGHIPPMLLFSSLSGVTDSNGMPSWPTKLIFQYYLGRIERNHKDGKAEL